MNYPALRYVAETCTIQGAGRALLFAIAYRADRDSGECWTALRRLAREAGIDYATAKRVKPELIDQGELEVILQGAGRRPDCLRITGCGHTARPQAPSAYERTTRPQAPVDNSVVGASGSRSGRIGHPVVGAPRASPIRKEGKDVEGFEVSTATAASVDDDPTADAVVVHSPNGQAAGPLDPGLSEATRERLAALKASIHDQLTADRQAERDRARDLLGPPTTEQETR